MKEQIDPQSHPSFLACQDIFSKLRTNPIRLANAEAVRFSFPNSKTGYIFYHNKESDPHFVFFTGSIAFCINNSGLEYAAKLVRPEDKKTKQGTKRKQALLSQITANNFSSHIPTLATNQDFYDLGSTFVKWFQDTLATSDGVCLPAFPVEIVWS